MGTLSFAILRVIRLSTPLFTEACFSTFSNGKFEFDDVASVGVTVTYRAGHGAYQIEADTADTLRAGWQGLRREQVERFGAVAVGQFDSLGIDIEGEFDTGIAFGFVAMQDAVGEKFFDHQLDSFCHRRINCAGRGIDLDPGYQAWQLGKARGDGNFTGACTRIESVALRF